MHKPSNYDGVQSKQFTGFNSPTAGAYVLGICEADETMSKGNNNKPSKPMLVLKLDIAEGEFKGNYREMSKNLYKDCLLKHYRLLTDEQAEYLKGDISAIEESNSGFKFNFDEKTLRGKLVGAMLQEEEYLASDNTVKSILKIAYLCSVAKVKSGTLKPLPCKKLDTSFDMSNASTEHQTMENDLPF